MSDEPEITWQEQETLTALRRLANARTQLAQLEEQAAAGEASPVVDPEDLARVEAIRAEVGDLELKARSRFGGGSARARIAELEAEERLVLQRAGAADAAALRAAAATAPVPVVDPAVLEFARRELRSAEAAWAEVQALELPEAEADDGGEGEAGEAAAPAEGDEDLATVTEIDLRVKPQAAS